MFLLQRCTFMSSKICFLSILIVTAFIASACSDDKEAVQQAPGVNIIVTKAEDIPFTAGYTGQTAGFREVEVRAQVTGILLKRYYTEGQIVKKGDNLFQIDPAPYRAALEQAKGSLAQAEAGLYQTRLDNQRMQTLYNQDAVSKKERDDALAAYKSAGGNVEAARGSLDNAKINLGYTKVVAPISGATSKESVSEGNLINTGEVVTKITQLDPLYVNFAIPGTTHLALKNMLARGVMVPPADGKFTVDIKLSDGSVHSGKGELDFVNPTVDPDTSSIKARAQLENPDGNILPGQFARVYLKGYVLKNAIAIPQKAVLNTQDATIVYVVDNENKAQARPIVKEIVYANNYIIREGLKTGEKVIVDGILKVRPGTPVTILKTEQPAEKNNKTELNS